MITKQRAARLAIPILVLLAGWGCGDSSPTEPTPSQAQVTVSVANPVLTFGSQTVFNITFNMTLTESAGLGANINFVRLEPRVGNTVVERQEIGSGDIIAQTGNNRVEGNSSRSLSLLMGFNNGNANNILLTVGLTDDAGNNLESSFTITF